MKRNNIIKCIGIALGIFTLVANIQYALLDYGMHDNSLGYQLLAQTSTTGDDSSGGDGGTTTDGGTGWGFGYDDRELLCPRDQWSYVTTATSENNGQSTYVQAGNYIPGTSVIAGTSGYYDSQTATQYANLRETYKQYCIDAAWHYWCGGAISCRVKF